MANVKRSLIVLIILFFLGQAVKPVRAYGIAELKADLDFLGTVSIGKLLFVPFGSNPDPNFVKHRLDDQQIDYLCDGDCTSKNIGANFGTFYKNGKYEKARNHKMNWTLEIAQAGSAQAIADVINSEGINNVVIRIGVSGSSFGFDDPNTYAAFLADIASKVGGKTFYAIAGPNEPDIETWATPGCSPANGSDSPNARAAFYECAGPQLADYMNAVIAYKPNGVKLLSPAFNLTSFMFNDDTGQPDGLPLAMLRHGANFTGLDAIAGNIYPNGDSMQNIWNSHVAPIISKLGKPVVITETGPWGVINQPFEGYDTSQYDSYNVDDDEFYIQPIKGIIPSSTDPTTRELWGVGGSRQTSVIRDDLIKQGYEAHCATPGFKIVFEKIGQQWMDTFLKLPNTPIGVAYGASILYPSNADWLVEGTPFRSTLTVDYQELLTPLFRDVSDKKFLMTSLEEFFGYKDQAENPSDAEINSSAINSLVTNQQRCILSVNMLLKEKEMCQKLVNPNSCALYPRPVTNTDWTVKQTLDNYQTFVNQHQSDLIQEKLSGQADDPDTIRYVCRELVASNQPYVDEELKSALLQVPLTLDRSYRLAFLVTTIEMKYTKGTKSIFNLYEHPNAGFFSGGPSKPKHGILVTAFKVPDITTNQGSGGNGNTAWLDAASLTRNSLLTKEQIEKVNENDADRTEEILQEAKKYDVDSQTSSDEIFCIVGQAAGGVGAPECHDPLSKALTDIVNTQANISKSGSSDYNLFETECPELDRESNDTISDLGSFGDTSLDSKLYTTEFGADLLNQLFIDSTHLLNKDESKPNTQFAETWREGDPEYEDHNPWGGLNDWGLKNIFYVVPKMKEAGWPYSDCCDPVEVKHFLVYPEGYTLKTIEETLAGSFFSQDQLASLQTKSEEYDRFDSHGSQVTFEGATFNKNFDDYSNEPPNTPVEGQPECAHERTIGYDKLGNPITETYYALPCRRSFGFQIVQWGKNLQPGFLGAKLGFWVRTIQQQLSSSTSSAWKYLDSCETTEQFLLGKCGNAAPEVEQQDSDSCTDLSCAVPAEPEPEVTPSASQSGSCLEIWVDNGIVFAKNKCACSFGDWQLQDAGGGLWCGPLGANNTLFPFETKGGFCSNTAPPNPVCGLIFAPGADPGNCLTANERVCVSW